MTNSQKSKMWRCPICGQINEKSALQQTYERDLANGTPLYGEETCYACLESFPMTAVYGGEYDVFPPSKEPVSDDVPQATPPKPMAPQATSLPTPPKATGQESSPPPFERVLTSTSDIPYFKLALTVPDHLDERAKETYLNDLFDFDAAMAQGDIIQADLILNYLVDDNPGSVPLWLNKAIVKSAKLMRMNFDQELIHDIIYYLEKAKELQKFGKEMREVALAIADIIASAATFSNFSDSFLYTGGMPSYKDTEGLESVAASRQAFTYLSQKIRDLAQ